MADDYAGLVTALGLGAVQVVGISMGGAIAQQLALRMQLGEEGAKFVQLACLYTILHGLGIEHTKLTYKFQGRYFRLTDVAGNVVDKVLA